MKENYIDKAKRFDKIMKELKVSKSELARRLGTSQPNISNHIRLLKLGDKVLNCLRENEFSKLKAGSLLRTVGKIDEDEMIKTIRFSKYKNYGARTYSKLLDYVVNKKQ